MSDITSGYANLTAAAERFSLTNGGELLHDYAEDTLPPRFLLVLRDTRDDEQSGQLWDIPWVDDRDVELNDATGEPAWQALVWIDLERGEAQTAQTVAEVNATHAPVEQTSRVPLAAWTES